MPSRFLSAEEGSPLNDWHILSGWVAGILVVFRIAWGFVGGEQSRFAGLVKPSALGRHVRELLRGRPQATMGHNALGALSVILLLAMVAATVWTGAILAENVHELLGWSLLALVAIHILAVVAMSLLTRENLVRGMVDGTKPADRASCGQRRALSRPVRLSGRSDRNWSRGMGGDELRPAGLHSTKRRIL